MLLNYFKNDVIALGVCTESKVHILQVKYDYIEQMNNKLRLLKQIEKICKQKQQR